MLKQLAFGNVFAVFYPFYKSWFEILLVCKRNDLTIFRIIARVISIDKRPVRHHCHIRASRNGISEFFHAVLNARLRLNDITRIIDNVLKQAFWDVIFVERSTNLW
jgi:hypothetical protein